MFLPRTSIRRPVFATVLSLLLIVLGLGSLAQLPVREFPDVDPPTVSVTTTYPGAAAAVVEGEITEVIEESVSSIQGIELITSTSRAGFSRIDIEFALARDLDAAAADVRDKLGQVRADLPEEAEAPVISKASGDAEAMMWLTLTSPERNRLELSDFADRNMVDPLSIVSGVSQVIIGGERRYAMRIWLDPDAMAARQVTVADVIATLRQGNVELPTGRIESEEREFTVRATTELESAEGFRELPIRQEDDTIVTLGDVAKIEVGAESYRSIVLRDGEPAVGLGIVRQSKSNTLAVADAVLAEVERLGPVIPDDIDLEVSYNEGVFIEGSIRQVLITLAITAVLVILVIFVFLRSVRAVAIPAATIPVALIASLIVLAALGYSINTLTLLALVLAVGLVVDDSIVVTENIFRRSEQGEAKLVAAARGGDQISFAVIATSLVLISVFVPLAFMSGTTGRLFTEFAAALAAAVAFSSLVALSLGPMLGSKLIDAQKLQSGRFYRASEKVFQSVAHGYRRLLERVVALPLLVVLLAAVLSAGAWFLYTSLPKKLAPTEDRGVFIIPLEAPEGSSLEYTLRYVDRIEAMLEPLSGEDDPVDGTISIVGAASAGPAEVNSALIIVRLKPWDAREQSQQDVVDQFLPKLMGLPGVQAFAVNPPSLGQEGFSQPVQFVVGGPDYETAHEWAQQVLAQVRSLPGLINARIDFKQTKPQVQLEVDREAAADLGLEVRQIGEALQFLFGELDVTDYTDRSETYEVMVRAQPSERDLPEDLKTVFVRSQTTGELIQLANVVRLEEVGVPPSLTRVNRTPSVVIKGSLAPGAALGDVLAGMQEIASQQLPPAARIQFLGLSEEYMTSSGGIYLTFGFALMIVFLVLAAQFESFIHPVVIMAAVPLAVTGGLLALFLAGLSFNIFSQIGLILIIGLTAKNGILVVEFANQLRDQGRTIRDAIVEAGEARLRPVVMTSFATAFGGLPLALSTGPGAESRATIGIVVIGGIIFATILTLLLVPALYILLARFTRPAGEVARRLRAQEEEDAARPQAAE